MYDVKEVRDWGETLKNVALILIALPFAFVGTVGFCMLIVQIFVWNPIAILPAMFVAGATYFIWYVIIDCIKSAANAKDFQY